MPGGYFESWLLYRTRLQFGLVAAPSSSQFRILVCNGASWGSGATKATIVATEIKQEFAYSRTAFTLDSNAIAYDAIERRIETPDFEFTLSPVGDLIQFNALALMSGASANANKPITAVTLGTSRFTCVAHGLTEGEEVLITQDPGGEMPGGINESTIYYAKNITTDTFQVSATSGGSAITFTTAGSHPLTLRYAKGSIVAGYRHDLSVTVDDGGSQRFTFKLLELNPASAIGVTW